MHKKALNTFDVMQIFEAMNFLWQIAMNEKYSYSLQLLRQSNTEYIDCWLATAMINMEYFNILHIILLNICMHWLNEWNESIENEQKPRLETVKMDCRVW